MYSLLREFRENWNADLRTGIADVFSDYYPLALALLAVSKQESST